MAAVSVKKICKITVSSCACEISFVLKFDQMLAKSQRL